MASLERQQWILLILPWLGWHCAPASAVFHHLSAQHSCIQGWPQCPRWHQWAFFPLIPLLWWQWALFLRPSVPRLSPLKDKGVSSSSSLCCGKVDCLQCHKISIFLLSLCYEHWQFAKFETLLEAAGWRSQRGYQVAWKILTAMFLWFPGTRYIVFQREALWGQQVLSFSLALSILLL